jgi:Immunoglobulin domain
MRVLNLSAPLRWVAGLLTSCGLLAFGALAQNAPVITTAPAAQTVNAASVVTLTVSATGSSPLGYQWLLSGTNLTLGTNPSANNSSLVISNVTVLDSGLYAAIVTNAFGSVTSAPALLVVNGTPRYTLQPTNVTVYEGQTTTLTAAGISPGLVNLGWYFGGSIVTSASNIGTNLIYSTNYTGVASLTNTDTNFSFTISQTTNATTGLIQFSTALTLGQLDVTNSGYYAVLAGNGYGSTYSFAAAVNVVPLPNPALQFGAPTNSGGTNITFPVLYTAFGAETNLGFSIGFDPSVYTNATFHPEYALDPTNGIAVAAAVSNGAFGLNFTLLTNRPQNNVFAPGQAEVGTVSFDVLGGNPYAGNLQFLSASFLPNPLTATNVNYTNVYTNVVILPAQPAITTIAAPTLNWQTGLFEQSVHLVNPGSVLLGEIFLEISPLGVDSRTNAIVNWNAQGNIFTGPDPRFNGGTYVSLGALAPAESADLTLEYLVPDRTTAPAPLLLALGNVLTNIVSPTNGTFLAVTTNRFVNGGFLVEFPTRTNHNYYVQYAGNAADLTNVTVVRTALPFVAGTGSQVQWLDNGPPKTSSFPTNGSRFYRVLETP